MLRARPARLCLADGATFEGQAVGASLPADGAAIGEVVFTTGMTGYQEVLTDPSYKGQIVTMTAPQIGNTGVNLDDPENAEGPAVAGFVVRELSESASNWRSTEALDSYLARAGVVALTGVDTRRLTVHLRTHGAQNGAIGEGDAASLVDRAKAAPSMEGLDLVGAVTCKRPYDFATSTLDEFRTIRGASGGHIVAVDFGMKTNILRSWVDAGCKVTVVPASTSAADILKLAPHGVFLSNGPGDPAAVEYAIETVRELLGKTPIFGICLGHQLLALAAGAPTYKLKFGHRGLNQPVKNLSTGRVEITSQNHGFAVDMEKLPKHVKTTHVHLNDGTSEGLEIPEARAFSVQFHPEAAAGPHDTLHLFERFAAQVKAS
ncbi:MAG: glutamine-hydrolyzing carbamoyl-phosphate synthase small subunit, partial [Myxococcales bacterium]|nr:glutamine-hydrolyzing carbamoyl-phosphate synthase small subunit [Myxococcales bacterium]